MQLEFPTSRRDAFMRIEVLCCIAAIAVLLVVLLLPSGGHGKGMSSSAMCVSNLKQTILGTLLWANENNGSLPWNMTDSSAFGSSNAAVLFAVMSNELSTPRILVCPADKERRRSTVEEFARLRNVNISYFVILDSPIPNDLDKPRKVVFGDRDIRGLAAPSRCAVAGVSAPGVGGNQQTVWLETIHERGGNVAYSDGSADTRAFLSDVLAHSNSTCRVSHILVP